MFRLYRIQRLIDAMRVQAHILKSTLLCTYVFLFSIGFFIDAMRVQAHVLKSTLYAPHVFYFFHCFILDAMREQAQVLKSTLCRDDFRHTFSKVPSIEALCSKMNRTLIFRECPSLKKKVK